MAHFVTIRNGGSEHLDLVRQGNEDVIRARYADAEYFYNHDCRHPLADYRDGLATLTFQTELGSMLDKSDRLEKLAPWVGRQMHLSADEVDTLERAALPLQSRPGHADGRRDDEFAGRDGPRIRQAVRRIGGGRDGDLRALPAAFGG